MPQETTVQLTAQILLGLCLASAAGLRAFLPLFCLSLAGRLGYAHLPPTLAWLQSDGAFYSLLIASAADFLADKIPYVHHFLDVFRTVLCPLSGMIVMYGAQGNLDPHYAAILALAVGLPLAGGVHVLKSGTRIATTASTGGVLSPVVSLGEDIAAAILSIGALVSPFATIGLAIAAIVLLARRFSRPAPAATVSG